VATTVIGNPDEQIWKLFSTFDKTKDQDDRPNQEKEQAQQPEKK
jgi:hypothetical protein